MKLTNLISGSKRNGEEISIDRLLAAVLRDLGDAISKLKTLPGNAVTIFGSARVAEGSPRYEAARKMAAQFAHLGYAIITGGGPGIMEAGNRGAAQAGGLSIGVNLRLPFENGNDYQDISVSHTTFATRKLVFLSFSSAFIVMPGGFGTLDELSEVLTHIQTGLSRRVPVVLFERAFWKPLLAFLRESLLAEGYIKEEDFELFHVVDSVAEAVAIVAGGNAEIELPAA